MSPRPGSLGFGLHFLITCKSTCDSSLWSKSGFDHGIRIPEEMTPQNRISKPTKVLCVGMTCVDVINVVNNYPAEDSDNTRGVDYYWQRGGNATNNTTVLSLLGVPCEIMGVLPNKGPEARWLRDDFQSHGIDTNHCAEKECQCGVATSIVSRHSGSRTIVYHPRDQPLLHYADFHQAFNGCFSLYSWIQFETNANVEECGQMLDDVEEFNNAKRNDCTSSPVIVGLEIEKPEFVNADNLISKADCVFISKDYARGRGCTDAESALRHFYKMCKPGSILVCPWGDRGAAACCGDDSVVSVPALSGVKVVDSLGAGDTFVAGFICGALKVEMFGQPIVTRVDLLKTVLRYACDLAGHKCTFFGFQGLRDIKPPMS